MDDRFCKEWNMIQCLYWQNFMASSPRVSIGIHKDHQVVRVSYKENGKYKKEEYLPSSPKAGEFLMIMAKQEKAITNIRSYSKKLTPEQRRAVTNLKIKPCASRFDGRFFDSLKECSNRREYLNDYRHNNIRMRSRAETIVADCLDKLGLTYKYEPAIVVGGEIVHPDFVVYIEALDQCVIIEFMGMIDDYDYAYTALKKTGRYLNNRIYPNEELILIYGTGDYVPSSESITTQIISMLNSIAMKSLVKVA